MLMQFFAVLAILTVAASQATAAKEESVCDIIAGHLPKECTCTGKQTFTGLVDCKVAALGKDRLGFQVNVAPCEDPAHVDFTVTESSHGVNFTFGSVKAGHEEDVAVPGATLELPSVGKVGLDVSALIDGDLDELTVKIGLNACGEIKGHKVCGSSLTKKLPFWVLHDTYQFRHLCKTSVEGKLPLVV